MQPGCFHNLFAWGLVCCFAGMAANGRAQAAADDDKTDARGFMLIPRQGEDWTRHFHIGAMVGLNIKAGFQESGRFPVSGNNPASGIYDDGYVREDQTGNVGGLTSYWGYNSASQYDAAAQTITMHGASSYATAGKASVDGDPMIGFDLAYGDDYFYWKHVRIGWELGFNLLPINIADHHPLSATSVSQSVFTFDTGGIVIPDPPPYYGGSSGQGSLLPGSYTSMTEQTLSAGTVTGARSLDVMLYSIRLGPCFFWEITKDLGVSLSAGPVLGVVSGDYNFDETITTSGATGDVSSRNKGSFGATDLVYGGYVNAALKYHVVDNGRNAYFYIGMQYTPLGTASFSNGGRAAQLNLDGQIYFSAGIGWPF